ncbi:MAG TPA: hypothetical protein P5081_19980 [Phycisphaerae bacterium]|nr:hypothetical protein [Phycisphaerae bacterium]HRW55157.1 hypothetical protein [Phycisphaerae bacterium]
MVMNVSGRRITCGVGLAPFRIRPVAGGRVRFTMWVTVFRIPIIPIRSWEAEYLGDATDHGFTEDGERFADAERIPHDWGGILATTSRSLALVVIAIAPAALLIRRIQGRAASGIEFVLGLASACWPVAMVVMCERIRRSRLKALSHLAPDEAIAKRPWSELAGALLFFLFCSLPALAYGRHIDESVIPFGAILAIVFFGGGVAGTLMVPSCPQAGLIAGFVAGPCSFFALQRYLQWRGVAEDAELMLVTVVACLPAIGLGWLLRRVWLRDRAVEMR